MLDLTPSLQYNAIAALSPPMAEAAEGGEGAQRDGGRREHRVRGLQASGGQRRREARRREANDGGHVVRGE
eukprot:4840462-Prymnesium_polylepis.1